MLITGTHPNNWALINHKDKTISYRFGREYTVRGFARAIENMFPEFNIKPIPS